MSLNWLSLNGLTQERDEKRDLEAAKGPELNRIVEGVDGLRLLNIEGKATSETTRTRLKGIIHFEQSISSGFQLAFQAKNEQLKDSFLDLRDLVLNLNGMGDHLEGIDDFEVDFDLRTASFTNPLTHDTVIVDLLDLKHEKGQQFCEKFLEKVGVSLNSNLLFSKSSGGNYKGAKPYRHGDTQEFTKLPKSFDECAERNIPKALARASLENRKVIMNRLLFAEVSYKKLPESIQTLIDSKTRALEVVSRHMDKDTDARKAYHELKNDINQLNAVKDRFNDIDFYALSVMLTMYPVGGFFPERIDEIAKTIEAGLNNQLKYSPSTWFVDGELIKERQKVIADYIQSVKLSLYKAMDRGIYVVKCRELGIKPEQEGMEDLIFRQALSHEKNAANVSDILLPALSQSYNPKSKKLEKTNEALQREIHHSVEVLNFEEMIPAFTDAELTVDASLKEDAQFIALGQAVQAIRGRINWNTDDRVIEQPVEIPEETMLAKIKNNPLLEKSEEKMLAEIKNNPITVEEPTLTRMKNNAKTMIAEEIAGTKELIKDTVSAVGSGVVNTALHPITAAQNVLSTVGSIATAPFRWVWNHLPTPADIDDVDIPHI